MDDTNSNPYQSPLIAADEHSIRVAGDGSRALHIAVVGFGAALGGCAMFAASVSFFVYMDGNLGKSVVFIPIGAVVGGLFAKWCALQIRPLR